MFLPSNITLKLGDSGDFVAELQRRLSQRDFLSPDMITSFYDGATVAAVRGFQQANGIKTDGVAGPETLRRLNGITDTATDSSSGNKNDSEQAGAITPSTARVLQLQMEEEFLRERAELQRTLEQQTVEIAQQTQHTAQAQQLEKSQLLTETKKQLPGLEAGRDQQVLREQSQQLTLQQNQQQQAFIDRPITQTFQSPEAKPELEAGTHNRGPNLGQTPEKSAELSAARSHEKSLDNAIDRTKDPLGKSPDGKGTELQKPTLGREADSQKTETGIGSPSADRAPLRIMSPSQMAQGTAPDFARIKQQMESRLPPHVVEEVKQVGVVMINQGVRGGQQALGTGAPERTPGMDEKQAAVGGGRGI